MTRVHIIVFIAVAFVACKGREEITTRPPAPRRSAAPIASPQSTQAASQTIPLDADAVLIHRVEPQLVIDTRHHPEGTIVVEASISASGDVTAVRLVQSLYAPFDQTAIDAVRQWKYKPAIRNGVPVASVLTILLTFRIDRRTE